MADLPNFRARLIVAGLVALVLLALGEQAPAVFPVHVSLEAHAPVGQVEVEVDGETHNVSSALGGDWRTLVSVSLAMVDPIGTARAQKSRSPL